MLKLPYEKPDTTALDLALPSYILMGSNEGYSVDPYDPFDEDES